MKSLSFSTATAAVAISLASTAHANETAPYVMPEMDTLLFAEPGLADTSNETTTPVNGAAFGTVEIPGTAAAQDVVKAQNGDLAPVLMTPAVPEALALSFPIDAEHDGLLSIPAPMAANADELAVTTRSLDPRYGDINAFYGDIVAFYGDIDAFWRDIRPFYGDISPFYGNISPFWGDISPFYGDISAFWGDIDAFWGDIVAFDETHLASLGAWGEKSSAQLSATEANWSSLQYSISNTGSITIRFDGTPDRIRGSINTMIAQAEAQFGAAYTARTGKSFRDGFVEEILARHGLDISNNSIAKKTLAKSQADRAAFYLDWHDSLMQYSGIDQVDHWMGGVNWTPAITQIQGGGHRTLIGVIDGSFNGDADLGNNVVWSGGGTNSVGGHGVGVASLIAGAHDGQGVMGIAPDVNIATYNPFDANGNSSWDNVADGFVAIKRLQSDLGHASVVNLSLGEPGYMFTSGTADFLYRDDVDDYYNNTVFVFAAGNEGVTQTVDVEFNDVDETALIFVGSVNPLGEISSFSNRPGTACLTEFGQCNAGNELYMRTVVAPGELLLVSDGNGGVVRRSGTSFAAPLVSGAVALLHDRWPWLANNPHESAEIIFRSARDLGAPGPDEVYGWGLLDVAASQSPLDFNDISFKLYERLGSYWYGKTYSATGLLALGSIPGWWDTSDVFLTGYENIGDTYRDFSIPMSAFTYGKRTNALGNGYQRLQDFVSDRFANWLLSGGKDTDGDGQLGISQVRSNAGETSGQWTMRFDAIAPQFSQDGAMRPVHNAATLTDPSGEMSFTLGHGQGALALAGNSFGLISDHDHEIGGVNPILGFASGEFFAGASYKPASATTLSVGYSANRHDWEDLQGVSEIEQNLQRELGAREAEALTFGVEQKITGALSVNAQWTHLREKDALLGAQTSVDAFLGNGSTTDAVTVTASMDLGSGFSFDLSATGGATETAEGQLLNSRDRVMSTAGQFTVNKRGIMGARDILRLSVGQPLTVESGELELRSEEVIDRLTGETGVVTQTIGVETKRRYTGEIVYATPVTEASEFGIVGRYISAGELGQDESFMLGANFGLRF